MTPEFFDIQWDRLVRKFGAREMDEELKLLARDCVLWMTEVVFKEVVDQWIGERKSTQAPRLSDFKNARVITPSAPPPKQDQPKRPPEEMREHMKSVLTRAYGGVKSATDALEVAKHKISVERVKDDEPNKPK
jgi:hypothetical protein